jgi:hypothetical protein
MRRRTLFTALLVSALLVAVPAVAAAGSGDAAGGCEEGEYHIPEDQDCDGEMDDQFDGDDTRDAADDCDMDYRIPEDRNCDGEVDDQFLGSEDSGSDGGFWDTVVGILAGLF